MHCAQAQSVGGRTISDAALHDDRRLPALTGVRFFAALAVVICHFDERGLTQVPSPLVEFLDGGRTAVSLFFVLSGFVLTYNYRDLRGSSARRSFYVNRIARIYPVVLLALALASVGVLIALSQPSELFLEDWFGLASHPARWLSISLASQLTTTTAWFPWQQVNQPWNNPAWSISCEMFFYAVFPFIVARFSKNSRSLVFAVVLSFAAQLAMVALALRLPTEQRGYIVYQFPITHGAEFVVGMVAAVVFARGGHTWLRQGHRRVLTIGASALILILLAAFQHRAPAFLPMTPFFGVLVLGLAAKPVGKPSWLAWRPLLVLGEASFALYLIHIPIINIVAEHARSAWLGWLLLVVSVAVSVVVLKVFETPARRWLKHALRPRRSGLDT